MSVVTVILCLPLIIFTVITEHPGNRVFWSHPRTYDQILAIKLSKGSQAETDLLWGLGMQSVELCPAKVLLVKNVNVEGGPVLWADPRVWFR